MDPARNWFSKCLLQNINMKKTYDPCFHIKDDSLTSLSWLTSNEALQRGPDATDPLPDAPSTDDAQLEVTSHNNDTVTLEYKSNIAPATRTLPKKPPYSYSILITMALKQAKDHKLTLADIYAWITNNFEYYRTASPSWQVKWSPRFILILRL